MSEFTVYESNDEVYTSTNKYMRFAIEVMEDAYDNAGHASIAQWYDNLLPIELKDMDYLPAEKMMHKWINIFFANSSRGGLIPTLAQLSGRRIYKDATPNEPAGWVHSPGDMRGYGVLEGRYASTVNMIRRIHYFLTWVPDGSLMLEDNGSLLDHCKAWAKAFKQPNEDGNWYGHRVSANSWQLYNFVHTGPPPLPPGVDSQEYANPNNFPGEFNERFDRAFRFALEGFPDSWWVMVDGYGAVAQAFVHLSKVSGDPTHADFAKEINDGLWNARLNHATYLMPDTVTPRGPLPGDQMAINGQWKYMYDTDCLYWARALFDAYGLVRRGDRNLTPTPEESQFCESTAATADPLATLQCRIRLRRRKLDNLLRAEFPDRYLGMALGLTLDWIRYGWNPYYKQFIRKIGHDGTPGLTVIYGDGKWNTLHILLEAYRFTHDPFYLDIFDQAWSQLMSLASGLGGLFPHTIENGNLPMPPVPKKCWDPKYAPDNVECNQEFFLDVIINAYRATAEAGQPSARYLAAAETVANKILAEHDAGNDYYILAHGILGGALVRLARAKGTLRRIRINPGGATKLSFTNSMMGMVEVELLEQPLAVVYMDDGIYNVVKHFADTTTSAPVTLNVTGDANVVL